MKTISLPTAPAHPRGPVIPQGPAPRGTPLFRLAFRPFYLGGAMLASIIIPVWVAIRLGSLDLAPAIAPLFWHAHEMLFGFAVAIIIGFLLTAGRNWTGLPTPRGAPLAALFFLWIAARILAWTGPYPVFVALDISLLPLIAAVFGLVLTRARNWRNLPLAGILVLLSLANTAFHLVLLEVLTISAFTPIYAALALVIIMECIVGGRVIPAFTSAATGATITMIPWLERVTMACTIAAFSLWVVAEPSALCAALLAAAALLHMVRLLSWKPWVAARRPILLVLHLAYAWIPMGLLLLALAQLGLVPVPSGVHALTVGATGGLIIGMISRTARGHTGRPIAASPLETIAYAMVMCAALARVFWPLLSERTVAASLLVSATLWSVAFLLFLTVFGPWLLSARADGQDG